MIEIKIDVTKINKSRLYAGQKGTYLTAVLIPTPDGKYGDFMVVEGISKEEREAGKKGTILGNGKNLVKKSDPQPEASKHYTPAEPPESNFNQPEPESDLPF
jgi:hypothetical protein